MHFKRFMRAAAPIFLLLSSVSLGQQPQRGLTATELVQMAVERNRDFQATKARVEEAEALLRQAGIRPVPTIEVETATGKLLGSRGEREYSASYFYPIERGGKRTRRIEVAEKGKALAEAELEEQKRQLAFDVKSRFIQAAAEELRLAAINRLIPINRENYGVTVRRVELGDAAPLEGQLLLTEVNRAEAQQITFSSRTEAAILDLKATVGLTQSDVLTLASGLPSENRELTLEKLRQTAVQSRADLRILAILEEQAMAEAELERAEGRPDLTASARYTRTNSRFEQLGLPETGTPVPSATPEPTPVKMISTGRGGYTVAVGAFQHSKNAWNERARFRNLGYPAVVQKRGKYYRVQIGQYSSLMSAKVSAAQLNKKGIAGYATRF